MASVVYANKRKKFRSNYPLPLKLRHGLEHLNALTDHEYRNMLIVYADELIYRTHRGTKNLKGKAVLRTGRLIEEKYLKPLYVYHRNIYSLGLVTPASRIDFWQKREDDVGFHWQPITRAYQKLNEPKKHLKYKTKWNVATKGPVEAELIKIDGPYSLAPWLIHAYKKEFIKCSLCGRTFSRRSYRKSGTYPRNAIQWASWYEESDNYISTRRFTGLICKGPCASLVGALDRSTIKIKQTTNPFTPLPIFLGVIDHANYNPYIRRLAEDFVRYARSFFESGSDSAGRESHRQVSRQRTEICIN